MRRWRQAALLALWAVALPPWAQEPIRPPAAPSAEPRLTVRGFEWQGRFGAASRACVEEIARPFLGSDMDTLALHRLRRKLTRECFVSRGYVNSGVLLPDQDIAGGIVRLQVVEGALTGVEPRGNRHLSDEFLRRRIGPGLSRPLALSDLKREILLLERHPLIQGLDAELIPGERPGEASLRLGVRENAPHRLLLALDNYRRSPSVGAEHLTLDASHLSLTGRGDRLSLELGATRGAKDARVFYQLPLGIVDSLLAHLEYSDSVVIETPFAPLDIESDYLTFGLGWERALIRALDDEVSLTFGLSFKKSTSRLLGEGFSFSPGVLDGESRLALLTFAQQWEHRSLRDRRVDAAWLLYSRFTLGLDALDATVHDGLPDGRFLAWLAHGQYRKRLDPLGGVQLGLRGRVQWADSPLLPLEKFTLGGIDTVRGYRENRVVRDSGWAVSLELHWTLAPERSPWGGLQLVPFVDYGQAWNEGFPARLEETLASVGAGLLWSGPAGLQAQLYAAAPLRELDGAGDDLQDRGLHFQVRYQVF